MQRKNFLKQISVLPFIAGLELSGSVAYDNPGTPGTSDNLPGQVSTSSRFRTSLNAYSFNELLSKEKISLHQLLEFCAAQQFDAVDITGYYFKGYPTVPTDEVIFDFKRKAHSLGISISGTGVRNDFTHADAAIRQQHVELVKAWIKVAAKLGAPVLRIFSGLEYPSSSERAKQLDLLVGHINECLPLAQEHGVIIAVQNHYDFLRTGDEVLELFKRVQSSWFGLVLDIGSYRGPDPFEDIRKTIALAVNWQIKEKMYINGVEQTTDLKKLYSLIRGSGYRGYLPIETLGPGDPYKKVPVFLEQVRSVMK